MQREILIDIGSSTVKVYKWDSKSLFPLFAKSIAFKKDFDPQKGISKKSQKKLYRLINRVKKENKNLPIRIFATAIFRKFEKNALKKFSKDFFRTTGVKFRVISQKLENLYLEIALVGKYKGKDKVLLINIGGGSTELVVMKNKKSIEVKNIELGVSDIFSQFPQINNGKGKVTLSEVKKFIDKKLPVLKSKVKIVFYSGGELNYMQLAKYKLRENNLFKDKDHPFLIFFKDFAKRNIEIFNVVYIKDLEKLMPENPTWMHGARACSAIAQAVCERYGIKIIIPSNANLINGVVRTDF